MKNYALALIIVFLLNVSHNPLALAQDSMGAFQEQSTNEFNSFSQPDANLYTGPALDYSVTDEDPETKSSGLVNQYNKKYAKKIQPVQSGYGFLLGNSYDFQFLNTADNNNAILRFMTPATLTGCATITQPLPVIEENPPYLLVKLSSKPHINIEKNIHYAPFHCDKSRQFAFIDVPLQRTALIDKKIDKLVLSGGNAPSRVFNINTDSNKIEVISGNKIASFPKETMLVVHD